jgi:hypothetical protein
MSIKDRIEEAEILWQLGRKEGAWTLALIAAAATARKRYPPPIKDGESFKKFIRGVTPTLIYGGPTPSGFDARISFGGIDGIFLEDIVYKHLRCFLVHEAEMSDEVSLSASKIVDGKLSATLEVGDAGSPHKLPDFCVLHLIKIVKEAPENAGVFT